MKEHREISLRINLSKGNYVIVPSTRNVGEYGQFTLSLYFNISLINLDTKCLTDENIDGIIFLFLIIYS